MTQDKRPVRLGELAKGEKGIIVSVGKSADISQDSARLTQRLMEMGLLEGSGIELVHEAPFGKDPVTVRARGALIALRRSEANAIEVMKHE